MLDIRNLCVETEGKPILKGINLHVKCSQPAQSVHKQFGSWHGTVGSGDGSVAWRSATRAWRSSTTPPASLARAAIFSASNWHGMGWDLLHLLKG